jgi:hypothetical protein
MTKTTMSLIDVLEPPANLWLRKLGRRAAELPVGVRVVRFSENDDDTALEVPELVRPAKKPAQANRSSLVPDAERIAA